MELHTKGSRRNPEHTIYKCLEMQEIERLGFPLADRGRFSVWRAEKRFGPIDAYCLHHGRGAESACPQRGLRERSKQLQTIFHRILSYSALLRR